MVDRLTLIMQLGALATDAAQRGDDRAAATCQAAAELLFEDKEAVEKVDRRRQRDRESRTVVSPRIPRSRQSLPKSSESTEIVGGSQGFSPTPPFPNSPEESLETACEPSGELLHTRMGDDLWIDVAAFIRRRDSSTWNGWAKEMLSNLTGGKALPVDLAQVCRDDEALTHRVGSPKGLRIFLASAVEERLAPARKPHRPRGGLAQRTFDNGRTALEGL